MELLIVVKLRQQHLKQFVLLHEYKSFGLGYGFQQKTNGF